MTNGASGGTWSISNSRATISVSGVVTGITAGLDTVSYTVINGCGTDIATKIITINPLPDAGTISGPSSVCVGSSITMTDAATGGAWSSSNARATITTGGIVTGVTSGIDSIYYTVTNVCGTDVARHIIVVNALPVLTSTTSPAAICDGSTFNYTPTSDSASASFSWSRAAVSGISNIAGSGTGNISEMLNSTSNSGVAVTYIYTTSANGCSTTQNVAQRIAQI